MVPLAHPGGVTGGQSSKVLPWGHCSGGATQMGRPP
jgi:hypothetical protein